MIKIFNKKKKGEIVIENPIRLHGIKNAMSEYVHSKITIQLPETDTAYTQGIIDKLKSVGFTIIDLNIFYTNIFYNKNHDRVNSRIHTIEMYTRIKTRYYYNLKDGINTVSTLIDTNITNYIKEKGLDDSIYYITDIFSYYDIKEDSHD